MNPQAAWPRRDGLVTESPFLGPGTRDDDLVDYLPMRLSLVPRLFSSVRPPDVVLVHAAPPRDGRSRSGWRSTSCPRRSSRSAGAAGWSSPR